MLPWLEMRWDIIITDNTDHTIITNPIKIIGFFYETEFTNHFLLWNLWLKSSLLIMIAWSMTEWCTGVPSHIATTIFLFLRSEKGKEKKVLFIRSYHGFFLRHLLSLFPILFCTFSGFRFPRLYWGNVYVLVCSNNTVVVRSHSRTFYIPPNTYRVVGMYLILSIIW